MKTFTTYDDLYEKVIEETFENDNTIVGFLDYDYKQLLGEEKFNEAVLNTIKDFNLSDYHLEFYFADNESKKKIVFDVTGSVIVPCFIYFKEGEAEDIVLGLIPDENDVESTNKVIEIAKLNNGES